MMMVMVMTMAMVMLMVDLSEAGDDVGEVYGELIVGSGALVVVALEEVSASNHFPLLVSSCGRCFCDRSFCYCHFAIRIIFPRLHYYHSKQNQYNTAPNNVRHT